MAIMPKRQMSYLLPDGFDGIAWWCIDKDFAVKCQSGKQAPVTWHIGSIQAPTS